jgi:hypothetical protein
MKALEETLRLFSTVHEVIVLGKTIVYVKMSLEKNLIVYGVFRGKMLTF